jgi:hypothetical protein
LLLRLLFALRKRFAQQLGARGRLCFRLYCRQLLLGRGCFFLILLDCRGELGGRFFFVTIQVPIQRL